MHAFLINYFVALFIFIHTGLLLPSPAVIYNLATSKYILAEFPPLLCSPENGTLWYYSTIFVINVLTGSGVCMLVTMLWIIHKVYNYFQVSVLRVIITIALKLDLA